MKHLISYLESKRKKMYIGVDELVKLPVSYIQIPFLPKEIHEQFPRPLVDFDINGYLLRKIPVYKGEIKERNHD